jgi:hypothetical protein
MLNSVIKRSVSLAVVSIFVSAFAFAQGESSSTRVSNPFLNDVVRMTKAGLSDATIVAYVKARRARLDSELSADDLIQLRRSGVTETVIQYLARITVDLGQYGESYDSRDGRAYPVEPVYTAPYGYGYDYPLYGGGYFSSSAVFVGRPFFRPRVFFHRPFPQRHFFGHRFFHRSFFRGRGFH